MIVYQKLKYQYSIHTMNYTFSFLNHCHKKAKNQATFQLYLYLLAFYWHNPQPTNRTNEFSYIFEQFYFYFVVP